MSESTQVLVVDWQAEMLKAAHQGMEQEKPDNKFISFKSGILSFNEQAAPGNKIQAVILGSAFENQYYPDRYDPNVIKSPDCWAVAISEDDLAPVADKVTNAVSEACAGCPNNEWESDPNGGRGKACKNTRRLAVVLAHQLAEVDSAETLDVMYARLPVTSVANWAKYVSQIGNLVKRPPWGVITEISVVPDAKSQFKVNFNFVGLVEEPALEGIHKSHLRENAGGLLFGYDINVAVEPKAASAKGKKF